MDAAKALRAPVQGQSKEAATSTGTYQGKPSSPDSVKFKTEYKGIPVLIERPKGFVMVGHDAKGAPWTRKYTYDYGHIPKTLGGDDDGLDVFMGPDKDQDNAFWAIQKHDDGSFDEYKVFLGFANRDEAIAAYRAHVPKRLHGGMMTMKVEMMKAMLGKNPEHQFRAKTAMLRSFFNTLAQETKWG